jgi:NADH-quinone oxidoreductase subunit N
LAVLATIFLASLAGIPPLGGWIGKFTAFQSLLSSGTGWGYYGTIMREMWMKPVPDGDTSRVVIPGSLGLALAMTVVATLVLGILPGVATHFGDLARITGAFGG